MMPGEPPRTSRLEECHLIRLSIEDQSRFAGLLLNPPEPNHAMKKAKEAHSRLVALDAKQE